MNNNIDNYLLNQNVQQQYQNPQSFETQDGRSQNMNYFQYQGRFQDTQTRVDFIQNVYSFLTFEFLFNLGMIALGIYTNLFFWLIHFDDKRCQKDYYDISDCITPSWLFYVSLFFSIILQFTLYLGGNIARKAPLNYLVLVLQLLFFGFTITTISIFMAIQLQQMTFWVTWGAIFLIIATFKILGLLNKGETSVNIGAIIIVGITIPFMLILIFFSLYMIWGKILCGLFIIIYGFYLMLETRLIMCKGTLILQPDDYLIGSLLLNGLMLQPLVRLCDFLRNRSQ